MAPADAELTLVLRLRNELTRGLTSAGSGLKRFATRGIANLRKVGTAFKRIIRSVASLKNAVVGLGAAFAVGIVARALGGFAKSLSSAAATAEEVQAKFRVVFGEDFVRHQAVLDEFGEAIGRGSVTLQGYAASIQDTLVPLGLQREHAAELSVELTKLALDLAAFNNVNDSEAILAVQSALTGQARALLRYGVVINEGIIDTERLTLKLGEQNTEIVQLGKTLGIANLIYRGSRDAQGALIRRSKTFIQVMTGLREALQDVREEIGEKLNKAILEFIENIGGIEAIQDAFRAFSDIFVDQFSKALQNLPGLIEAVADALSEITGSLAALFVQLDKGDLEFKGTLGGIFPIIGRGESKQEFQGLVRVLNEASAAFIRFREAAANARLAATRASPAGELPGQIPNDISLVGLVRGTEAIGKSKVPEIVDKIADSLRKASTAARPARREFEKLASTIGGLATNAFNKAREALGNFVIRAVEVTEEIRFQEFLRNFDLLIQGVESFASRGASAFVAFASGAQNARDAFNDFARNVALDILFLITRLALLKAAVAITSEISSTAGTFLSQAVFGAKGFATEGGQVVESFQSGGAFTNSVVRRPTAAPLAVFGEAGPEAIVPLARTSSGNLGVESTGGSGMTAEVNISIAAVDAAGIDQLLFERRRTLADIIADGLESSPTLRAAVRGGA